ncbi:MAG: hypothetical protein JSV82_00225 [Planctomycetota bacterium]|nr:MAG: hypothetical protein JSV82_00225 [Planctomycetota bacterium]
MKTKAKNAGSVFMITVFVIAFLSAVVGGICHINAQEIQLMRNQIWAAQALATAEAGLNEAMAELRLDKNWSAGFHNKVLSSGLYTVVVGTDEITATASVDSWPGYTAKIKARFSVKEASPYVIRIDSYEVNEYSE